MYPAILALAGSVGFGMAGEYWTGICGFQTETSVTNANGIYLDGITGACEVLDGF
jgi:hypothetical protein